MRYPPTPFFTELTLLGICDQNKIVYGASFLCPTLEPRAVQKSGSSATLGPGKYGLTSNIKLSIFSAKILFHELFLKHQTEGAQVWKVFVGSVFKQHAG